VIWPFNTMMEKTKQDFEMLHDIPFVVGVVMDHIFLS
jgi:hypothetical protein